ncbi:MAG TPA: PqqD family protein [Candidatus Sulfotelmatobacter sp.]|nr:PqqD family protein [Candidatus Sulfotelmatobacter sp.]
MFKVYDSVRSTHGQDGAIVLDVRQGQMFNLNVVGSRILELLESGSSEGEIANVVSREFNADIEMVRNDVKEFLETIETHNLLKTSSDEQGRNGGTRC